MTIIIDYVAAKAASGTELMMRGLDDRLSKSLNNKFSIGRAIGLFKNDPTIKIYWTHNLPTQRIIPEIEERQTLNSNSRWDIIDGVVFVSEWQKQEYIKYYNFSEDDISHLKVLRNAIVPIEAHTKPNNKIKLIYTSVPERGLQILYDVFDKLSQKYDNIELDVYSSYKIYGIPQTDIVHRRLLDQCKNHPKINYYGTVSNDILREAFKQSHIFAYPSTFLETSCISLIEAMSAGCVCVHPDIGALGETGAGFTQMYQKANNRTEFHPLFESALEDAILKVRNNKIDTTKQVSYANDIYSWNTRIQEWNEYLTSLL
tara:strand:- start:7623 stop:8570 length:948 start_codon:yes stop_codon:yes gene_type:complete